MKRALAKTHGKDKEDEELPPTQRIPEEDYDDMGAHEALSEDPGSDIQDDMPQSDFPEQPDLGWYLGHWEMSPKSQIAICRTFANYLSAQLPKVVEGRPGRFSGKKLKK